MQIKVLLILIISTLLFTACVKKIDLPIENTQGKVIKLTEAVNGYYENKLGKKSNFTLNQEELKSKYPLLVWPGNYDSICIFDRPICLIDINKDHYFSHSAIKGRSSLYPLVKKVKYSKYDFSYFELPSIYKDPDTNSKQVTIHHPKLNKITTKDIGEPLYQKMNQINLGTFYVPFYKELSVYLKKYNQKTDASFNDNFVLQSWPQKNFKTICDENSQICLIDTLNNNTFSHFAIEGEADLYKLTSTIPYKKVPNIIYNENSFKYEVYYQGIVGNKIKISFKEFFNDMVRPAFTQEIEYQVEKNKPTLIGFKGLRIKILKATNYNITYLVVSDFK